MCLHVIIYDESNKNMNLTKYGNLTDDELITEALVILTNEDDLSLELLSRLMDMKDELDRWKADYEDEVREIEHHYDAKYRKVLADVEDKYV